MSLGTQSTKTNPQGADAPRRVRRWLTRGSWAIFDKGLFAGANFVLNVLLARLISPADYGVFSVSYALLLLAGTVHTAFLTEPMLVFGPGRYRDWFRPYLSSLVNWHWRLTGLFAAVFLLAGAVFLISNSDSTMGWAMMARLRRSSRVLSSEVMAFWGGAKITAHPPLGCRIFLYRVQYPAAYSGNVEVPIDTLGLSPGILICESSSSYQKVTMPAPAFGLP